jgi:hypothetical protein
MIRLVLSLALVAGIGQIARGQDAKEAPAESEIFSGPQVGETLGALNVKGVYGDQAGKTWDLLEANKDQPKLLVFMHKQTRPAFGLSRVLLAYANKRKDDKLTGGVIWLAEDATETENWLSRVKQNFPETKRLPVVYSPDGIEGPGTYGLNRNVTMTILVADKNKVTANFALVQPSLQADFPKIMEAVIAVAGGEMPKLSDLEPRAMGDQKPAAAANDEKMTELLRSFIQKDATDEQVKKMAEEIETYIKDKPKVQTQLGTIISRIQSANKLSNYGTAKAQEYLSAWGKKYGPKDTPRAKPE